MIQRYDLVRVKYTDDYIIDKVDNGDYVLYTDHLAAITEKDREIERLNEHLAEKDNEISDLKRGDELYRKWVEDTQKWLMR
jgi:predicted RNase H-like nuclease (RuvC/YqgF family)